MKRFGISLMLLLLSFSTLLARDDVSLSGYIKSASTGEGLIGATVYIEELKTGTTTNLYGFYSISLPQGKYTLQYSYIGFENTQLSRNLESDITVSIELQEGSTKMEEVVVHGRASDRNIKEAEMSVVSLSPKETKLIPVLAGEPDILKTLQLLPGVNSGTEGTTGFYVRGGGADQNLIILDEAPVYSASHLMGFFSVFNTDAIKGVELYKGNAPAELGGRLSSVVDIKMNEGNSKQFSTSGGIGLLSSRLTVETPTIKNKGSLIVTGRRSYADAFMIFSKKNIRANTDLYFYDLNAKTNLVINDKNRVYLSGYFGRDVFNINDLFALNWGNKTGTLRWNHVFGSRIFLNSSLIYSDYNYGFGYNFSDNTIFIKSSIKDINLKEDFQFFINTRNTIKFGVNAIYHRFSPGKLTASNEELFNPVSMDEKRALESAFYFSHKLDITEKLKLSYGLRYSGFITHELDTLNADQSNDKNKGTQVSTENGLIHNDYVAEPRVTFNYILNNENSIKFSYARNAQYIHLLSNSTASLPTDVWMASSKNIKPQIADQLAIGYFRNFNNNMFESSVELYYKDLYNQIDYMDGAQLLLNKNVESQLLFGIGRAYGAEFYVKKRTGKLTGWIGYTISKTEKSIEGINSGVWYPTKYDRIHDISIVAIYKLNQKWTFSANWVYNTGNAVTFPSGKYQIEDFTIPAYTKRNEYRMPDYHRLDISTTFYSKKHKKFESSWNFSIYNVYARRNAFSISFRENEDNPNVTEAVRLSLFTMIPSITYNFKF